MSDRARNHMHAPPVPPTPSGRRQPPHHSAWVDVDLDALVYNYRTISQHIAPSKLIAVVKGYGLGTGTVMAGRALEAAGVFMLAVSNFHEAMLLRKSGIWCPVLAMNGLLPEQMDLAIAHDISFFGFDAVSLRTADALGEKLGTRAKVHIKVDTGMGRLGILPGEAEATKLLLDRLPWVQLEGIASHIASPIASEHNDFTFVQQATFVEACETIDPEHRVIRHISSSNTVMRLPELNMDAVRCQAILWGVSYIWPAPWPLKPVASYKARLVQVKMLPAGHNVGYRLRYSTSRPTLLGVIPLGTIDGLTPDHAGKGHVLVGGERCPILAVCTCESMIDVTDVPGARAGDEVALVGEQGDSAQTAMDFAQAGGISFMNLLTKTGARVPRVYRQNGAYAGTELFNQEDWE